MASELKAYWLREFYAAIADGAEFTDADLARAIEALRPKQREVVELKLCGLTQEAIAEALGIHQSRVSRRLKLAQEKLPGLCKMVLERKETNI